MSKEIHLTVDLSVGDVEDYLYREPAKSRWNGLTDDEKWECFDYIWDHQDDTEYEMGFYDGDLCTLVEEWWMENKYQEESRQPRKLPRKNAMNEAVDMNKPLWEGWSAQNYADENEELMDMIMAGRTWRDIPKTKAELKITIANACLPNVPKLQRAVVDYFAKRYNLK